MSTVQGSAGLAKTLGPGLPSGFIRQVGPLTMAGQNSGSRYSIRIHSSRVSCDNRAGQNNDSESSIGIHSDSPVTRLAKTMVQLSAQIH